MAWNAISEYVDVWFRCTDVVCLVRPSVRPGFLLCAVLDNSCTPPEFMLFSYLESTMLFFCKSEFMVIIAYKSGNLWMSDLMLFLLYPCCNHLLDLMDCIM